MHSITLESIKHPRLLMRISLLFCLLITATLSVHNAYGNDVPGKEFAYPPIFIHGFTGSEKSWDAMAGYLEREGYKGAICEIDRNGNVSKFNDRRAGFYVLVFKDNSNMDFRQQGQCVRNALDRIRKVYAAKQKFVLVGHSMGGLAARAYLSWYSQNDIAGLITIGTPHLGSYIALLPDVMRNLNFSPEVREIIGDSFVKFSTAAVDEHVISNFFRSVYFLKPGSVELNDLNAAALPEDVTYYNIIGRNKNDDLLAKILLALSFDDFLKLGIHDVQTLQDYYKQIFEGFREEYRKVGLFASFQLDLAFSDGVVPVTSQYMRSIYRTLDIETVILEPSIHCRLEFGESFLKLRLTPEDVKAEVEYTDEIYQAIWDCQQSQPASTPGNSFLFLIDVSASMRINDPDNVRTEATKMIVEVLKYGDRIGIVTFSSGVSVLLDFMTIRTMEDRFRIKEALESISSGGETYISGALQLGNTLIERENLSGGVIAVLLTDGEATRGDREFSVYSTPYEANNVPVYAIGLTGAVNEHELYKLASKTGGEYFKARSASELIDYFERSFLIGLGKSLIVSRREAIKPLETRIIPFPVDVLIRELVASLSWEGSDLDLTLIKPDGSEANRQQDYFLTSNTYEFYTIGNPEPGIWKAKIFAADIPAGGESFSFKASGDTPLKAAFIASGDPNTSLFPYELQLQDAGVEIRQVQFNGILIDSDGQERPLSVIRSGFNESTIRASISLPRVTRAGEYTIRLVAKGLLASGAGFSREIEKTVVITSEQVDEQKNSFSGGGYMPMRTGRQNNSLMFVVILFTSIGLAFIFGLILLMGSKKMRFGVSVKDNRNQEIRIYYFNRFLNRTILIGRASNCKIRLRSKYISKYHCMIKLKNNIYILEDLNSKNGIYFNGKKIAKTHMDAGKPFDVAEYKIALVKN